MGFFRRRNQTYNEQMLREAGFTADGEPIEQPEADGKTANEADAAATMDRVLRSTDAVPVPPGWESAAIVDDASLTRNEYSFATLPDGSLIVDDDCDEDLSRLADAAEQAVSPPYEAKAVRRADGSFSVTANTIDVVDLPYERADNLELACYQDKLTFTRDGEPADAEDAPQALLELGRERGDDYVVEATRLDGPRFDVTVRPL